MRIDCEKCGAAFAIEDRLVPAKGVRAQCPKCRNIQLVKRPDGDTAAPKNGKPHGTPQAPIHTPQSPLPAQLAQAQRPQGVRSPSGSVPAVEMAAQAPTEQVPKLKAEPTPNLGLFDDVPKPDETSACATCGKPMDDPFDRALGTCDDCRQKADAAAAATPSAQASAAAATVRARVGTAGGFVVGAPKKSERKAWPFLAAGGALLLVAAAAFILIARPFASKPPADKPVPAAVMTVLPRWKLSFMGLSGTSGQFLAEADAAMQLDTPAGYLDAEEAYQKALILDPDSDDAVVGYVRAVALGRGALMDEETFQEALALADAARSRTGESARTLVAEAQLRLARSSQPEQVAKARALSERVLTMDDKLSQAEAHLVLGRTFVATSLALALQHFDRAVEAAPELTRVQLFRALAYEASGDIQRALGVLQQRLEAQPDHPGALAAISRLYQESGDTDAALDVYQRALQTQPSDFRANLMTAVLRYQSEAQAAEAVKQLSAMAKDPDRYDDRDRVELLTHLSAAQRASGNVAAAVESASAALAVMKADPGAHLQLLLLALDREQVAEAAQHLAFVTGHLGDAALEQMLVARVRLAEGKGDEAARLFKETHKADARRTDALIMAGVAYAIANKREVALATLAPLEDADPLRTAPRAVVSRFYIPPNEFLRTAGTAVEKLAKNEDDVSPRVYQGLIHWHRGEHAEAAKLLKQVVESDTRNAAAQAYLALLDERRGEFARAKAAAEKAVQADRRKAVAHYALGTALQGLGDRDGALRAFQQAELVSPSLLAASLRIAQLDAASGRQDRAKERLGRALSADPSYLPAKQILYALSIGGSK